MELLEEKQQNELKLRYDRMIDCVVNILKILNLENKFKIHAEYSGVTYRQFIFKKMHNAKIIIGPSNESLGEEILKELGMDKVECNLRFFADKSPNIEIKENIRGANIFIIQTGANDSKYSLNDYFVQLLAIIDTCKRSGSKSITAIIPFYPNARSDKRDAPRVPIMAKATTVMLENIGADRIIMIDLHSKQIQGFGDKPIDNLNAKPLFTSFLNDNFFKNMNIEEINKDNIFVSPDVGGCKRVHEYSETMKVNTITMHKERDYSVANKVLKSIIIGKNSDISGKRCFIIDDMIDTAGTLISGINELVKAGAKEIIPIATHGVFSKDAINKINNCPYIEQLLVTNTLPQNDNIKKCIKKIHVINVGPLLAYTIVCLIFDASVSKLLDIQYMKY